MSLDNIPRAPIKNKILKEFHITKKNNLKWYWAIFRQTKV
jgi:hypothetical protein